MVTPGQPIALPPVAERAPPFHPLRKMAEGEVIAALTHLYRGEQERALAWQSRLDTVTTWALLCVAGLLSLSFLNRAVPPALLLLGHGALLAFLCIEARRYKFLDLWRWRVRLLEANFFLPVFTGRGVDWEGTWWTDYAHDLAFPTFKISTPESLGRRLRRCYYFLFLVLLGGWAVKVLVHLGPVGTFADFILYAGGGAGPDPTGLETVSGWAILGFLGLFHLGLLLLMARSALGREGPDRALPRDR